MKKVGEFLKQSREYLNISINEVSMTLKINVKYLKAIESGDLSSLPPKAFVKGFIKSYASYLHLNPEHALNMFSQEVDGVIPEVITIENSVTTLESLTGNSSSTVTASSSLAATAPSSGNIFTDSTSTKTIFLSLISIAIIGFIVLTTRMIDKYSKETVKNEEGVNRVIPDSASAEIPVIPIAPVSPVNPTSSAATETTNTTNTTNKSATNEIATKAPSPSPSPSQTATAAGLITQTPPVTKANLPTTEPLVSSAPSPKKPFEDQNVVASTGTMSQAKQIVLIVEAIYDVDISYSTKSKSAEKLKLQPGQVHTFKSQEGLKLLISNGGAVNITHNGQDLGIPGEKDKPVELKY